MTEAFKPIPGHAVFLLLVQIAALLILARAGAELAKRIGLPAVVGELAAGIVLGPSVFGHYFPHAFRAIFPPDAAQHQLLEVVGMLGMVLLLLLTGLETDLRLLKNLGRAALIASGTGMIFPFVMGFVLGVVVPAEYLANPDRRILFALFLATAMSISAMPVIAKILLDLDLTKRNIGLVILSAGVVDDTAGWLILSLIAGAASTGAVHFADLGVTLVLMVVFLALCVFVLYPLLRLFLGTVTTRFKTHDADLVLIVVTTCLAAAATEWIGIHAVFGAFIVGTVFRQVPRLSDQTVHRLESFVFAILAPIFFGIVGLKVDLWQLGGGGMLGIVLAVACIGKLVGVTMGGIWGGMRFWEALSIAVAMNARGAMELVVATIGLSLGILNPKMFSIIVVVAIVTSFMAPMGLRLTMRLVRMTEEEQQRILAAQSKGVFDPHKVRLLLPTAGGASALGAARVALSVSRRSDSPLEILHVDQVSTWWERLAHPFSRAQTAPGVDQQLEAIKHLANGAKAPHLRRLPSRHVAATILEEARKGYDLVVFGATPGQAVGGIVEDVVEQAPCHVAIVMANGPDVEFRRVLVPIDGSTITRVAAEFAVRYAEAVGAALTLAVTTERRPQLADYGDVAGDHVPLEATAPDAELDRISSVFRASELKPNVLRLAYDPTHSALADEVESGKFDLVVLGAENRAIQHRLFFGYENERLLQSTKVAVAIVVPNFSRLG